MERIKELRMTAVILLVGMFLLSGCFFSSKHEVAFKTNWGSEVKNVSVKSGNKIEVPETPTKEGYVFEGWYLNGKEYNFEDEVNEDITLVAKWRKVDVDGEEENEENKTEEEDTTTEKVTTERVTKKKTTVKKTTTKKKTTTSKKEVATTKKTTSSTTTTSKTPIVPDIPEETTKPIKPTEPIKPEEPTIPEKKELKMNITIKEVLLDSMIVNSQNKDVLDTIQPKELIPETPEEIKKNYNLIINLDSEDVNTISNLGDEDLQEFLSSDIDKWEINDQTGTMLELTVENNILSSVVEHEVRAITIKSELKAYVITFDEKEQKWIIDYPSVMVKNAEEVKYYADLETSVKSAPLGATVKILKDMDLTDVIIIDKPLNIDGGNFKINSSAEYLFDIKNINDETREIIIANMEVKVNSLLHVEDLKIKAITIENIKGSYENKIMNNESWLEIVENNLKLDFLEIKEDNSLTEKTL